MEKFRGRPISYCDDDRADIGRYTTEHGLIAAAKHFFDFLCQRHFKKSTRVQSKHIKARNTNQLKIYPQGVLLLFQEEAHLVVWKYIKSLRSVGSSVNTWMGAITPRIFKSTRGSFEVKKFWANYLLFRMAFVRQKNSNTG